MKPLTERQRDKWERTRRMGRKRYTFYYGALLWGIPVALIWSTSMSAILGWNRLSVFLLISLLAFPVAGVFFGKLMWRILEARYAATPLSRKPKKRR
jgi:hypothetical protein